MEESPAATPSWAAIKSKFATVRRRGYPVVAHNEFMWAWTARAAKDCPPPDFFTAAGDG